MENLNQLRVNILLDPSRGVTTGEPAEPKGSLKFLESRLWILEYYSSSKKIMWLRTCRQCTTAGILNFCSNKYKAIFAF